MLVDPIAELRSPAGSLISLYLDHPHPFPARMPALISDMLRPVRQKAETLSRDVQKSVRSDIDRIRKMANQLDTDSAPAYAIFASEVDDIFVFESLTHHLDSFATLGPRPYMRPLRVAPRPLRGGVLVADRAMARVFLATGELVEEFDVALEADIGKSNFGGFSGYSEYTVRSHAEEESAKMWKEAGSVLMEIHLERPIDYIVIGAADEMVEEIGRELHPYLQGLYRTSFPLHPQTLTESMLKEELVKVRSEVRQNRQTALAGRVCDTAWSGGLAVLGLSNVIEYVNAQAVDTLVVAGPFSRQGRMCPKCEHLARVGQICSVCGSEMFEVDDVVAAAMDVVVEAGGKVYQIDVASPLDTDGIGALSRFRIGN